MPYLLADLNLLVEVVVDLQQLLATFSLVLIFVFGFAAVFFSCHPLFPLHQALQTLLTGCYYSLLDAIAGCPVSCLLPQLGHFLQVLKECPFVTLLLVNELSVFTNYTSISIRYGASRFYFSSCLKDK